MRLRRKRRKPDYARIAQLERELGLSSTVTQDDLESVDTALKALYTGPIKYANKAYVGCQERVWAKPRYDQDWLDRAIEQDRDHIAQEALHALAP